MRVSPGGEAPSPSSELFLGDCRGRLREIEAPSAARRNACGRGDRFEGHRLRFPRLEEEHMRRSSELDQTVRVLTAAR